MIEIKIYRNSQGRISGYDIRGHHGEYGSDIVCAGISSLAQTALKGIGQHLHRDVKYDIASGDLHVKLKRAPDELTDAILETMLIGLYDVREYDPEEISISVIQEV